MRMAFFRKPVDCLCYFEKKWCIFDPLGVGPIFMVHFSIGFQEWSLELALVHVLGICFVFFNASGRELDS